jgi:hypothetical protein
MDVPEPSPSLYPIRLPPSTYARRFKFASDSKEDDVFRIDAEVAAHAQGTIYGDIVVGAV